MIMSEIYLLLIEQYKVLHIVCVNRRKTKREVSENEKGKKNERTTEYAHFF